MDPEILKKAQEALPNLPPSVQQKVGALIAEARRAKAQAVARFNFMEYVKYVWPGFIHGRHHEKMAHAFEQVAAGKTKRLIINMPPRHTKSEFASYLLPSWFLGKYPDKKIIQTSHTAELAVGFGRKVRNLVDSDRYKDLFPDVALQADSKAAGRWATNYAGEYFAIGVGGAVTGKGADLLIIDDPHSEQEAALAEVNPEIYDKTYEWYTSGPRQRLQPGGSIIIVMCMTGDTPVLMASGVEKQLKYIRPGDLVATYENGRITTSKVNNWKSNGFDLVYTIQTQSGIILRANKRHPFLVDFNGDKKWIRLKDLTPGMQLVATKAAADPQDHKQNLDYAYHVSQERHTTANTPMRHSDLLATMENGKVKYAMQKGAVSLFTVMDYVQATITKIIGLLVKDDKHQKKDARIESSLGMVLLTQSMNKWLQSAIIDVIYVGRNLLKVILEPIGTGNFVLTTAMKPEKYEDYYAMTATSQLGMAKHQRHSIKPLSTYNIITDKIVSIDLFGEEEVFDVEIDRTENFIANGVVSHNTRWSQKDLTAQVLKASAQRGGDEWEVIEFPALFDSGEPLWPQFWSKKELLALKEELPNVKWMAQYQQNPTSETTALIKRWWWQIWEKETPPYCEFTLMSWDTAFEKSNRADYSACTLWGVFYQPDENGIEQANIILLNAFRDRMEFPTLKRRAIEEYKEWEPDSIIIEKRASGAPLIYEMRAMGIPVQEYTPSRGNDKFSRLNSVADLFASKRVWAPNTHWAEEVIDEVASFPSGEHDDYVDSVSLALMRFRRGGYIRTVLDEEDEPQYLRRRMEPYY